MADKITDVPRSFIQEVIAAHRELFGTVKEETGRSLIFAAVIVGVFHTYQRAASGMSLFGAAAKEIGRDGVLFMVAMYMYLLFRAPFSILRKERDRADELERRLSELQCATSNDPVVEFKDWIVSKSKELLGLQSEIEFLRWKESVLKGLTEKIKSEYNWNEMFEGDYQSANFRGTIGFSGQLITIYEHAMEGMRQSVTAAHLRKAQTSRLTPIEAFTAWIDDRIDRVKSIKSKFENTDLDDLIDEFTKWWEDTAVEIGNSLDPELEWEQKFRKCQYHFVGDKEFHLMNLKLAGTTDSIGEAIRQYVVFLELMRSDVRAPNIFKDSRWVKNGS